MGLSFHWIPAKNGEQAEEHLNAVIRRVRVLAIEKHLVGQGAEAAWAVCVEYADVPGRTGSVSKSGSVDYREVLEDDDFRVFSALRKARKKLSEAEGVPVYAILTNVQLAQLAQQRCKTLGEFEKIEGVGEARAKKYGEVLLRVIQESDAREVEKEKQG